MALRLDAMPASVNDPTDAATLRPTVKPAAMPDNVNVPTDAIMLVADGTKTASTPETAAAVIPTGLEYLVPKPLDVYG
jgi:hypothetical protein